MIEFRSMEDLYNCGFYFELYFEEEEEKKENVTIYKYPFFVQSKHP